MDLRHPVKSVQRAWQDAIEKDLAGLNSDVADAVLGASAEGPVLRRPMARECSVAMFTQVWRAADLGMDRGPRANEDVDAETVIVTGPAGDACVYAGGRRLYSLARPNRRFFLDVAAQQLRGPGHAAAYNGRDSADLEAFDFEVAASLERLRSCARHAGGNELECIARCLRSFLEELKDDAQASDRQHLKAGA